MLHNMLQNLFYMTGIYTQKIINLRLKIRSKGILKLFHCLLIKMSICQAISIIQFHWGLAISTLF